MNRGWLDVRQRRPNRAIESLDMTGLDDRAGSRRDRQQRVGLLERRGDRLLDQHMHAALERLVRDLEVPRRRHDDRHRVDVVEQGVEVAVCGYTELRRHLRRSARGAPRETPNSRNSGTSRRMRT